MKPAARLEAAYADALGVTAAFNRNALHHVNRLIGSDFVASAWRHCAFYDAEKGRVEMHLEATTAQVVRLAGTARTFAAGERIHTENSCKYTSEAFAALLGRAGFGSVRRWTDPAGDFAVFLANSAARLQRVLRARRTPENCQRASGGKKLRYVARMCERGVAHEPPRSTYWLHMNLPLYSPTAPAAGAKPG